MSLFYFSQYSAPLLIGFLQGNVFAVLLLQRAYREERLSDKLMALLLVLCCAHIAQYMLGFGGWYDSRDWKSTFMFYFPFHNYVLLGPVVYFYFLSLTNQSFQFKKRDIWHFIPGLIWISLFIVSFFFDIVIWHWLQDLTLPDHYGTKGYMGMFMQGTVRDIFNALGLISFYIYLIFTIRLYQRYRKYIINNFSDTENIKHTWLRNILYVLIVGMTVQWAFQILDLFLPFSYIQFWNSHLAVAIMIYIISISAYISTSRIPHQLAFQPEIPEETPIVSDTIPELSTWKSKLEKRMEQEQLYLDPNLTLSELAKQLKTNTSVLSKIINQGFNQNFNDFINSYRVAAVEERLKKGDHKQLTLVSIAFDCGFNSKATFNRAFKKFMGQSPREFIK